MDTEQCLNHQKRFFTDFAQAWQDRSDLNLYDGIDATADSLRLEISEVPDYILAYDKQAESELESYLQEGLVKWLAEYLPFFEISPNGIVMFGDWYHRRQFGVLDVWQRRIVQTNEEQRAIIPELQELSTDPDNYLQSQLNDLHNRIYEKADALKRELDASHSDDPEAPASAAADNERSRTQQKTRSTGFKNFFQDFMEGDDSEVAATNEAEHHDTKDLQQQYDEAKQTADQRYNQQQRQVQVESAVVRYEYQAVVAQYPSMKDFMQALNEMPARYMDSLKVKAGLATQSDKDGE
ncbi:hypothetical protein IV38_GL001834 [Lactobacillus selangorensis]|uniref:Exonuclease SbcC n=1 Tax=Lactobacillus selangorensis TaxID=81857 RepID=A0A0R2FH94_9LACO|nr:hypothetical protein [Lactobacillus selangorensis]KRN27993.1 hypothetical protein IV38_GL001834 [Lactobacillus selangorensis]KRN30536.1 hypothetical protein IV40_GL001721 [Lactobacillus selangorensis]